MADFLMVVHWLSGLVVMAEALNKLERCDPARRGIDSRERMVESLKAFAWGMLAMGAGGALVTPVFPLQQPGLADVAVLLGFATLIIRTRVKEG